MVCDLGEGIFFFFFFFFFFLFLGLLSIGFLSQGGKFDLLRPILVLFFSPLPREAPRWIVVPGRVLRITIIPFPEKIGAIMFIV